MKPDHPSRRLTEDLVTFVTSPGFPFDARNLLDDLRTALSRRMGHPLTTEHLARIMGQAVSTTHFWFGTYRHPHLLGFMALLELLPPAERQTFLASFCRTLPTLDDPRFVGTPGDLLLLLKLLRHRQGLTVITGPDDGERTCLLTAIGHSYCQSFAHRQWPTGIDLHFPTRFVPVPAVRYLAETTATDQVRKLTLEVWPKIVTSKASLLLFNRVWSKVPAVRADLLRSTRFKHVVLADEIMPDLQTLQDDVSRLLHVDVSSCTEVPNAIRIVCRRASV
jgi:hypothetical protein